MRIAIPLIGLALLAGAAASPAASGKATARLIGGGGASKGVATLVQTDAGVALTLSAMGLPPGSHGIHLHMVGACDGPDFTTAGSHWNPTDHQHGSENPAGPHMGDMTNITVDARGRTKFSTVIAGARLSDGDGRLLDADGAALVIHAGADDYKTDPSGNSGGRIACGIVRGK